jgi:hypothetical protein
MLSGEGNFCTITGDGLKIYTNKIPTQNDIVKYKQFICSNIYIHFDFLFRTRT